MRRAIGALLALSLVGSGWFVPLATSAAVARCFDERQTLERRTMRGNLDGDGGDEVWLGARTNDGRCDYYVFARTTAYGSSRVAIPAPDRFTRASLRLGEPIALVRIDGSPGREIAVKLLEGASVRAFGFFTIRRGHITRMDIGADAPPLPAENMFGFGGGLALMFATDCAYGKAERTVTFSRATRRADGATYRVQRRWYQVRGSDFVRTSHPAERDIVGLSKLRDRFPEFRNGGLLPRCDGTVADG